MNVADLARPFSVVADREDAEHLGPTRGGNGGDEFPALLDLGEVHGGSVAGTRLPRSPMTATSRFGCAAFPLLSVAPGERLELSTYGLTVRRSAN